MRGFKNFISVILVLAVILSTIVFLVPSTAGAAIGSNPLLSRGVPAYALHNQANASLANDNDYSREWQSYQPQTPTWLAYDLSKVPANQRGQVIVAWYNNSWGYDSYAYPGGVSTYNVPSDYTIEVNNAAGGGNAPTSGWVVKATVTGNYCHSRQHLIDMTGFNWVRINVSKAVGDSVDVSLQMDIHSAVNGVNDDWLFLGDSITAGSMTTVPIGSTGTFAQLVNALSPSHYPVQECGGIGGWLSSDPLKKEADGRRHIDRWLAQFPGKYVTYNFGTNDAGWSVHNEDYYANLKSAVEAIIAAGKIAVIPKIPWARSKSCQENAPRLNTVIEQLYAEYPGKVLPGPDLWTFFSNNQNLISSDNLHPSAEGYAALRKQWAEAMNTLLYNSPNITSTPVSTTTATSTPTPTKVFTPTPTSTRLPSTTPAPTPTPLPTSTLVAIRVPVTISGTQFFAGTNRIWMNGANTPWNSWNDFGGTFDATWWTKHFQQLHDNGINSTRVWITCSGEVGINIDSTGFVSGATAKHWADLDSLFSIAQAKGIYLKATLMSFDHFKNTYTTYDRWRKWINSDANIDSYTKNYLIPFVNRYKSNPALWCIDFMNEPDWVYENAECGQISWDRLQTYFAKASVAVHANSSVLTTVDTCMNKYVSNTASGSLGNKLSDSALMAKVGGDARGKIDFYNVHQYDWQTQYWGNSLYTTPANYGLQTDRPCIIGECPAKGSEGHTITDDYENAYKNGWQGVMAWTSNGVDTNGSLAQLGAATTAFMKNHPQLVFPGIVPTSTPTLPASPSPTPAPTQTSAPHVYKVSGYVSPDFTYNSESSSILKSGFKIEIAGIGLSALSDGNGYFEIKNIPFNAGYTIKISKPCYLYRELRNIQVSRDVQISAKDLPILLWAGDMSVDGVQDNAINMVDIMEIAKAYNSSKGEAPYRDDWDINKDNAINMSDIMIIAGHFNKTPRDYEEVRQ